MQAKRIMIIGSPGSGKTTLALRLKNILHLPIYHLDRYFRVIDDSHTDIEQVRHRMHELVANDCWIIDGNYNRTLDIRLSRADFVIFLNYPKEICLKRAKERFENTKGTQRFDAPIGMIDYELDMSFMDYIENFPEQYGNHYEDMLRKLKKSYIVLSTDSEVDAFVNSLKNEMR